MAATTPRFELRWCFIDDEYFIVDNLKGVGGFKAHMYDRARYFLDFFEANPDAHDQFLANVSMRVIRQNPKVEAWIAEHGEMPQHYTFYGLPRPAGYKYAGLHEPYVHPDLINGNWAALAL